MRAKGLWVGLLAAVLLTGVSLAGAGESATTWRAGDSFPVTYACSEAEPLAEAARLGGQGAAAVRQQFRALLAAGTCFRLPVVVRGILAEHLEGALPVPGSNRTASLWSFRVRAGGSLYYGLLYDDTGGHEAATEL